MLRFMRRKISCLSAASSDFSSMHFSKHDGFRKISFLSARRESM